MEDGCTKPQKFLREIIGNRFSSAYEDPSVVVQTRNPINSSVFPNGFESLATEYP